MTWSRFTGTLDANESTHFSNMFRVFLHRIIVIIVCMCVCALKLRLFSHSKSMTISSPHSFFPPSIIELLNILIQFTSIYVHTHTHINCRRMSNKTTDWFNNNNNLSTSPFSLKTISTRDGIETLAKVSQSFRYIAILELFIIINHSSHDHYFQFLFSLLSIDFLLDTQQQYFYVCVYVFHSTQTHTRPSFVHRLFITL